MTIDSHVTHLQLDRAAGVLLGSAAGDALGAGYEFISVGPADPAMVGGGYLDWEPGEWTDDTQMAICIAEEAATGFLDASAVACRFLDWFNHGPRDVGNQTAAVLSASPSPGDLPARAAEYLSSHPDKAAGNGSLMRTGPVALAAIGDDVKLARLARSVSELTHADPLTGDACVLWCVGIDRAVRQGRLDGVRDGLALLPEVRRQFWADTIEEATEKRPSSFNPNGYVVSAFQAALASVLQTPVPATQPCRHLQEALRTAVGVGYDTDTVAAIAGSLLGARWGATAVPARWQAVLHGWPSYRSGDLVRLAVLAVSEGRDNPTTRWPSADDLSGYYDARFPAEAIHETLEDDDGVIVANWSGAAEVEADVAVSLCRVGRGQIHAPESVEVRLLDEDAPEANPNLEFLFTDLVEAITAWRDEGKKVLVHCVQAERRTPAVAAAYLANRLGIPGEEAFERVRKVLLGARVNPAFRSALERLWP
ncbi:MAG: ADP-ribosylglycohydrolase family protein [Acidimicrobiales bacterium]|jgi:ADP-ribosylglycohydrolase